VKDSKISSNFAPNRNIIQKRRGQCSKSQWY